MLKKVLTNLQGFDLHFAGVGALLAANFLLYLSNTPKSF